MIRFAGSILLICCSGLLGIAAGLDLKTKLNHCSRLCSYLECLAAELEYSCAPLEQVAKRLFDQPAFQTFPFAQDCSACRENAPFSLCFRIAAAKNRHIFGEQVFSGLEALSDQLGNFPVETQLAAIAHCKRLTEHFIDVHQNRYEHNIKLYRTLGFLGGTAFAILIW